MWEGQASTVWPKKKKNSKLMSSFLRESILALSGILCIKRLLRNLAFVFVFLLIDKFCACLKLSPFLMYSKKSNLDTFKKKKKKHVTPYNHNCPTPGCNVWLIQESILKRIFYPSILWNKMWFYIFISCATWSSLFANDLFHYYN